MSPSPNEYLQHILAEANYLLEHIHQLNKETFMHDETLKRAFVRSIEIIGEASKNVTQEIRQKYPQIPWRMMAGMRDRLIHGYFGIDYDIVWDVVVNKIPILKQNIEIILQEENK